MLGAGIFLIVIGAIVSFVLQIDIPGLGDQALGFILMAAGLVAIALHFMSLHKRTTAHATTTRQADGQGGYVEDRHIS
jgi:hypothetical protein